MGTWLLVAGVLCFAGSTIGFLRLQFSDRHALPTLVGSVLTMIAAVTFLGLAVWIGSSGDVPYSVTGVRIAPLRFHPGSR
jgi:hypothetical protein